MGGAVGGWALPQGLSAAPGSSCGVTPAGADLLKLTREDVIQICGPADGIRLFNALKGRWVLGCLIEMGHWSGQDLVWTFQFGSWDGGEAALGRREIHVGEER